MRNQEQEKKPVDIGVLLWNLRMSLDWKRRPHESTFVQTAIDLLEDRVPKSPTMVINSYGWDDYFCPKCNELLNDSRKPHFCENCGQAVKWDEE